MSSDSTMGVKNKLTMLLADTRLVLRRRAAMRALVRALPAAVWLLAVGAFLALVGSGGLGIALMTSTVVLLAACATWAWQRECPSLQEAAERLDAAQDKHNRIATAWAFAQMPVPSAFVQGAIAQGVTSLLACRRSEPLLQTVRINWRAALTPIACFAVAAMLYGIINQRSSQPEAPFVADGSTVTLTNTNAHSQPGRKPQDRDTDRDQQPTPHAIAEGSASEEAASARNNSASRVVIATTNNPALQPGSAAGAAGNAQGGGTGASSPSKTSPSAAAASANNPSQQQSTTAGPGQAAHAQIRGAAPGTSAGRSAAGNTDNRDQPAADDEFVPGDEEDTPEEIEQQEQRGGLRAALLDRRAAASRELGITGPKSGRPGTGRGGPTPRKKSRGTASIIMGVPMPDFLAGQRRAGPFVSNDSRVAPLPGGSAAPGVELPPKAAQREAALQPFVVPRDQAETVKQYLRRWHSQAATTQRRPTDGEEGE